jgi:hypothetical protein
MKTENLQRVYLISATSSSSYSATALSVWPWLPFPYMFSEQLTSFWDGVVSPTSNPLLRRTGVSLLVWVITFDLSGKGGPTSSNATAGIAISATIPYLSQTRLIQPLYFISTFLSFAVYV